MNDEPNDDVARRNKFSGRTITLARGSKVYVGRAENGDAVIKFTNNQGTVTSFGLSASAADALRDLLVEEPRVRAEWQVITEGVVKVRQESSDASESHAAEQENPDG